MQCVILAGGLATRMKPLTEHVPKAMLLINDFPFIYHQLNWLSCQGIEEVVLCIGHLGEMIRDFVGTGERWNLRVTYVDEGSDLSGTGGALRKAFDAGVLWDRFFVMYGDSFLPIPFRPVWKAFQENQGSERALMTVFKNQSKWDKSNVCFESGKLRMYAKGEKQLAAIGMTFDYIDYGLSILDKDVIHELIPSKIRVDLSDLFHTLSLQGKLLGYEVNERFYEIGSLEGLEETKHFLKMRNL